MIKKRTIVLAVLLLCAGVASAQDRASMAAHEERLRAALERASTAADGAQRLAASTEALSVLASALEEDRSERWQWKLPRTASVLTSPDKRLRVFSWAVVNDAGEYECFGAVQYYSDRDEGYRYELLEDHGYELMNREESLLGAERWLGAVYQELIQTTASDRTYYTLLGWNGVDALTDLRVIEPVSIRGGKVQFGAALFRRERNLRRIVVEYRDGAAVQMAHEEQTVQTVTRERVKQGGRMRTVEKTKEHKERMIIFDEVEPQVGGMRGLYQYYVPSGLELAYVWVDGKWELRHGAQGRLADKKLNKAFEPLPKQAPAYKY